MDRSWLFGLFVGTLVLLFIAAFFGYQQYSARRVAEEEARQRGHAKARAEQADHEETASASDSSEATDRADLRKTIASLRDELTQKEETIRDLKTRLAEAESRANATNSEGATAETDDVASEEETDRPDLKTIRKKIQELAGQGLNAYALLGSDHPLLKTLRALDDGGMTLLADLLTQGSDNEKFLAAALMEKLGDPRAIPHLTDALSNEKENVLVRRMASHALAFMDDKAAVAPLQKAFREEDETGVRINAAFGLAKMGDPVGIKGLRTLYDDTEKGLTRTQIFQAMAVVGHADYAPVFRETFEKEKDYGMRYLALTGLAKAGSEKDLPLLRDYIDDPEADKSLVIEAKKAYNKIYGQEIYPVD